MSKLILILTLISNMAFADSTQALNKGEVAPYSGVLMPIPTAQAARKAELELPSYKQLVTIEKSNNDFLVQKVTILQTDNKNLADSLHKQESSNNLEKVLIFLGGVALTALAVDGASKLK